MILASLADYYERRSLDPDPARRLPAVGLEYKEIPYLIELTPDGRVLQLVNTQTLDGKRMRGKRFLVPQGEKKTSGVKANLLWDSVKYIIGSGRERKSSAGPTPALAFRARLDALPMEARTTPGVRAVLAALDAADWSPLHRHEDWPAIAEANLVLTFRLSGESELVCQHPAVLRAAQAPPEVGGGAAAICLVTGERQPIARLHTAIKGVWGAQTAGANIVSFNPRAFESYGKAERQGENAPVGERAAFAYTTALNHLLARGSRNRVQVGDSSTVFWADRETAFDGQFTLADYFGDSDDPDRGVRAVQALFEAIASGRLDKAEGDVKFFVLGLAPNASRISIRFWLHEPLARLGPRIAQHFRDLAIIKRYDGDPATPSLFRLLGSLAVQGKVDNVPPRLAGEWMRAILEGSAYPPALLNAAVIRCRAERDVSYLRAAILKACLNRLLRVAGTTDDMLFKEELDVNQDDTPYRLGRLFAVLERIQQRAQGSLNATIRDRYFGAASTAPVAVFTTLLRLKNAHLKKLRESEGAWFERLIGEITGTLEQPRLTDFPGQLTLREQARFALGYYHQRQSFFTRKDAPTDNPDDEE